MVCQFNIKLETITITILVVMYLHLDERFWDFLGPGRMQMY